MEKNKTWREGCFCSSENLLCFYFIEFRRRSHLAPNCIPIKYSIDEWPPIPPMLLDLPQQAKNCVVRNSCALQICHPTPQERKLIGVCCFPTQQRRQKKENAPTPRHVMEKALTPLSHSKQLPSLPRLYYWYTYVYGKSGDGVGRGFYRWCLSTSFSPAVKPPGLRNVGVVVVVVVGMFKNAPEVISMLNFEVISEVKKAQKGKKSFAAFLG